MAINGKQEALRVAHQALVAAYEEWTLKYQEAHATLRYEELVPVAEGLNEVLGRLVMAADSICERGDAPNRSEQALTALAGNVESLRASLACCRVLSEGIASGTLDLRSHREKFRDSPIRNFLTARDKECVESGRRRH